MQPFKMNIMCVQWKMLGKMVMRILVLQCTSTKNTKIRLESGKGNINPYIRQQLATTFINPCWVKGAL